MLLLRTRVPVCQQYQHLFYFGLCLTGVETLESGAAVTGAKAALQAATVARSVHRLQWGVNIPTVLPASCEKMEGPA